MSCEQLLAADHPIPRQVTRSSEHIHLTPVPSAPREARRFVRATADVLDDDRLHDLLVLTSELVTNAVLHARTPFEVGVTVTDDAIVICVGDGAKATPQDREQSDRRESGRGIMLVQAMADEWGVLPAETREGKAVWFLFNRTGADQARVVS
jgi:anti-sigma regulatory factor (Ser/Thr protein kinase)